MIRVLPFEIRDFLSLNDLHEFIEKELAWYENVFKEYSEKLGSLLRDQGFSSEEIEKILRERGLTRQSTGKKGKKGKETTSQSWFSYKGLLFSADKQGQAEILFESIENVEKIIKKIKETQALIEELQKIGLGPGLAFSVYLVDGVPEKIFVQKAGDATRKYKLELFLSTSMESADMLHVDSASKETEKISEGENEEKMNEDNSEANKDLEKDQEAAAEESVNEESK